MLLLPGAWRSPLVGPVLVDLILVLIKQRLGFVVSRYLEERIAGPVLGRRSVQSRSIPLRGIRERCGRTLWNVAWFAKWGSMSCCIRIITPMHLWELRASG